MKNSQWIVVGLTGIATAIGVAYAAVQLKTAEPEINTSNNIISNPTQSQPLQLEPSSSPKPTATPLQIPNSVNTAKPDPIAVTPPKDGCKISTAVVADPNPPLNVRSSPQIADGNIIGQLKNGAFVGVTEEKNGWIKISEPEGWISKNRTKSTCPVVTQQISFPPKGDSAIVKGEIIGGGSHSYKLKAVAGQTITVKKLNAAGVFPTIIDPKGQLLAGNPYTDGNRTEWTGELPLAGDYSLEMDSNFKGFVYEFLVEVK
ncbi:MAG: SH3 domain-containing protein [Microcoleus vaginatus WJT46-NPBG5]|jgi:hypothetical protein|nr:SH3 domain-containing protein [Microcoleus vaginatus WJT46-NPBG5]